MSRPVITTTYWFASSSGSGTYETLRYTDGTTSCSCPGWTRRVDKNGGRSCKHTRMVDAGIATIYATSVLPSNFLETAPKAPPIKPTPPKPGQRKLIIE